MVGVRGVSSKIGSDGFRCWLPPLPSEPKHHGGSTTGLVPVSVGKDVGQTSRVIDADMHGVPSHTTAAPGTRSAVGDPASRPTETPELLHIDMDQLARVTTAIAVRGLGRSQT